MFKFKKSYLLLLLVIVEFSCQNKVKVEQHPFIQIPYIGCEGCLFNVLNLVKKHNENCENKIYFKLSGEVLSHYSAYINSKYILEIWDKNKIKKTIFMVEGFMLVIGTNKTPINASDYEETIKRVNCN